MDDTGNNGPGEGPVRPETRLLTGRRKWVIGLGALALTGVVSATLIGGPGSAPAAASGLSTFDSCQAVDDWFTTALAGQVGPFGIDVPGGWGMAVPLAAASESAGRDAAGAVGNGPNGTNVQEAGVDEADVVKTSGRLLVTTRDASLVVLDTSGEQPRVLGRVELPERAHDYALAMQSSLLVTGDRVLVLTDRGGYSVLESDGVRVPPNPTDSHPALPPSVRGSTVITVVDIAHPETPRIVGSREIEGSLVEARLHDGSARVVTTSSTLPEFVAPSSPGPDGQYSAQSLATATAGNRQRLDAMTGEDFLPHVITRNAAGKAVSTTPAVDCASVSHPADFSGTSLVTVSTLRPGDLADGADPVVSSTAVTANADSVYAVADRLYVTTNRWIWGGNSRTDSEQTEIHAFDTTSADRTRYVASGEVRGTVIGQWAFSARDGVLRVATTRTLSQPGATDGSAPDDSTANDSAANNSAATAPDMSAEALPLTDSAVSTMVEKGDRLVLTGSVDGLGKGERIQSVRWFDDTAYVVTFRQTDPLYVVDLSNPATPRVTGELKVPGFSQYLHPIGHERLLGVGQSGDENGATGGLQVSTFDISDPNAPKALDVYQRLNAYSEVQTTSRAFSFLPGSSTAILPVNEWSEAGWNEKDGGGRILGFTVGRDGKLGGPSVLNTGTCQPVRAVPVSSGSAPQRLAVLCTDYTGNSAQLILTRTDLTETGRIGF